MTMKMQCGRILGNLDEKTVILCVRNEGHKGFCLPDAKFDEFIESRDSRTFDDFLMRMAVRV